MNQMTDRPNSARKKHIGPLIFINIIAELSYPSHSGGEHLTIYEHKIKLQVMFSTLR